MLKARELVELTKKRDRLKKEALLLDVLVFEQKFKVRCASSALLHVGMCAGLKRARRRGGRQVWEMKRKYLKANNLGEESLGLLDGPRTEKKKALVGSPTKLRIKLGGFNSRPGDSDACVTHSAPSPCPASCEHARASDRAAWLAAPNNQVHRTRGVAGKDAHGGRRLGCVQRSASPGGAQPARRVVRRHAVLRVCGREEQEALIRQALGSCACACRTRFSERFTGIDPGYQPLSLLSDQPLSATRPEEDYVDMTDVRCCPAGLALPSRPTTLAHQNMCARRRRTVFRRWTTSRHRTRPRHHGSSGPRRWPRTIACRLCGSVSDAVAGYGSTGASTNCSKSATCAKRPRQPLPPPRAPTRPRWRGIPQPWFVVCAPGSLVWRGSG